MARVTPNDVNAILHTDTISDSVLDSYINIANSIVTDNFSSTDALSDSELVEIERWLTAHLIAITKARMGVKEKLGDAEITYAGAFGTGLLSTPYGQTVSMLDTTGTLAALGKKKISIKAITSFEE